MQIDRSTGAGTRLMPAAVALLIVVTACQACSDYKAGVDAYDRGDYATALTEFRPLAQQGHAGAQSILGFMYLEGHGVPQDYAEAVRWFRRAAEQGDADAQYNLTLAYMKGQGAPQDYVQAYMWVNLAVAQGREDARKARDILAEHMTAAQMDEARRLAREWRPKQ